MSSFIKLMGKDMGYRYKLSPKEIRRILDKKDHKVIIKIFFLKKAIESLINDGYWETKAINFDKVINNIEENSITDNIIISSIINNIENNNFQKTLDNRKEKEKLISSLFLLAEDSLKNGAIQPTLWESSKGQVHAIMRTSSGSLWRADSQDYGKTWSEVYDTGLPNNNSAIDIAKLDSGRLVLVMNPVAKNWGPRTPLTILTSDDNGRTWEALANLEDEQAFIGSEEFSYPSIIKTSENSVIITYTWKRKNIVFWEIPSQIIEK